MDNTNAFLEKHEKLKMEDLNYDQYTNVLTFSIKKITYKPKILRYVQRNYVKIPIYSDKPSISEKNIYKFNQKINLPLFCEKIIWENTNVELEFKKQIYKYLKYEPKWLIYTNIIESLTMIISNLENQLKSIKDEKYNFKKTNYNEKPGNFWLRFTFLFFTFGLSFIGYNSKSQAIKNINLNKQNEAWNKEHKIMVDYNNIDKNLQRNKIKDEIIELQSKIYIYNEKLKNINYKPNEEGWINIREALKFDYPEIKNLMGIYIIWNKTLNKYYVGQSKNLYKRLFCSHFSIARNDVNNVKFAKDWYDNHDFLYKYLKCKTKDELDSKEKEYIEIYDSFNNGYNNTSGNK